MAYSNEKGAGQVAVDFDGTNDYLTRGSDLLGNADSKLGLFSFWVRFDGDDDGVQMLLHCDGLDVALQRWSSNKLRFFSRDVSNGTAIDLFSTADVKVANGWTHCLIAIDTSDTNKCFFYIDDAVSTNVSDINNVAIDYTQADWILCARDTTFADKVNGAISEFYFAPGQWLDISIEANRRLFIDANGQPVYLGESGEKPTGTAPILYFNTPAQNCGLNSGSGGDFTINGAPTDTAGPLYVGSTNSSSEQLPGSQALDHDGTNDWVDRGGGLTGAADGKKGTISAWIRLDGDDGAYMYPIVNTGITCAFQRGNNNRLRILLENSVGTRVLDIQSTLDTYKTGSGWHHFLTSWDLATETAHMYIDDVDAAGSILTPPTNDTIDYTVGDWGVGATAGGSFPVNGALNEVYLNIAEYIDITVEANRRKFISASGTPVALGAAGELPTGTQPILYMPSDNPNTFGTNLGSGGDFGTNGAPTLTAGPNPILTPTYDTSDEAGAAAVQYDGTNDYLNRGADLTGSANGKEFTVSLWFKATTIPGIVNLLSNQLEFFRIILGNTGTTVQVYGKNAGGSYILSNSHVVGDLLDGQWHHYMLSANLATAAFYASLDDSVVDASPASIVDDDIDFTRTDWAIAAYAGATGKFNGALSEVYFTQEYLDLSVEANRRKFISSAGKPVPLGGSGELPTGTPALIYLNSPVADAGNNLGTGGDFTINGAPTTTEGPIGITVGATPRYEAEQLTGTVGMDFDGSTAFLERGSDLTGNADAKVGTVSTWARIDGNDGVFMFIHSNISNQGFTLYRMSTSNEFRVLGYDTTPDLILDMRTSGAYTTSSAWVHILSSWDLGNGVGTIYVDDVAVHRTDGVFYVLTDGTINYTGADWHIGSAATESFKWNGALSEIYFTNEYIDLTVEDNRRKFISADLQPVFLGNGGELPTGTQPLIYTPMDNINTIGTNLGTGGDFTQNGTIKRTTGPAPIIPSGSSGGGSR